VNFISLSLPYTFSRVHPSLRPARVRPAAFPSVTETMRLSLCPHPQPLAMPPGLHPPTNKPRKTRKIEHGVILKLVTTNICGSVKAS
jgi:hypothetical protein